MKKRILSLVLALSMMISLFPVSALAQTPGGAAALAEENGTTEGTAGTITINSSGEPVIDGLNTDSDGYWVGNGWKYMDGAGSGLGTLTLTSGTWDFTNQNAVKCYVAIDERATVAGGTFENTVWNQAGGKISGGTFKKTIANKGTITGGIFVGVDLENTSVINSGEGKITGGVFKALLSDGIDSAVNQYRIEFADTTNDTLSVNDVDFGTDKVYVVGMDDAKLTIAAGNTILTNINQIRNSDSASKRIAFKPGNAKMNGEKEGDTYLLKLNASLYEAPLAITSNGVPDTSKLIPDAADTYYGSGWAYDGTTLTLTNGNWDFSNGAEIQCNVKINEDVVLNDGTINGTVKNYGTIKDGTIRLCDNYGTIENGTFDNPNGMYCIWNYNLISGGVFEQGIQACVEGGMASKITGGTFKSGFYTSGSGEGTTVTGGTFASPPKNATGNAYSVSIGSWLGKCNIAINGVDFGENLSVYVVGQNYSDVKITATAFDTYTDTKTNTTKKFKEWQISPNDATLNAVGGGTVDLTQKEIEFIMPDSYGEITLAAKYETVTTPTADPELVITNGVPDTSEGHAKQKTVNGKTIYYGNGWEYDGTTLTLNPTSAKEFTLNGGGMDYTGAYLKCDLEVGENATVKGTITFTKKVTNNGTLDGMKFGSIGGGVYPSLTNNGTVKNCSIAYASVTNNKTMENVSFVTCSKLENSVGAMIENAVIRKDSKSITYRNYGKMNKAVFDFEPMGQGNVHVLKAGSGEDVVARLDGCEYSVFGTQVYIVGEPELKAKISGDKAEKITDVNGNKNYGNLSSADANGYHTFQVQSNDAVLVLNQIGAPDPGEVEHTLTLTDAVIVKDDGSTAESGDYKEGATVKIKPQISDSKKMFNGEWFTDPGDFKAIKSNDDTEGTYTLTMPGYNLSVRAESTYRSYQLTVNGGTFENTFGNMVEWSSRVTVTANAPDAKKYFAGWEATETGTGVALTLYDWSGNVIDLTNETLIFPMPDKAVTLTAVYKDCETKLLMKDGGTPDLTHVYKNEEGRCYEGDGWWYFSTEDGNEANVLYLRPEASTEYDFTHTDPIGKTGTLGAVNCIIAEDNANITIADGTFAEAVDNIGTIKNGIFNGVVYNGDVQYGGTIENGTFMGKVINKSNGTITGGIFAGGVERKTMDVISGGIFNAGTALKGINGAHKVVLEGAKILSINGVMLTDGWSNVYAFAKTELTIEASQPIYNVNGETTGATGLKTSTIKFTMSDEDAVLNKGVTPTPDPAPGDAQPKTYTVTVKGGTINGKVKVEGVAKGTELTVDVNESDVPEGMTFDVWSITFPEDIKDTLTGDPSVKLHDPHMNFTMPEADITIEAQYRSSELPGEDDGPSALGTMATVAVGGAAAGILVWQGVSLGVDSYLQLNLPEGAAMPANRRELVLLLWETAGKPETALPSLYSDVPAEEIELQKATRWAIDNGLVKPADDSDASRFDPDHYVTKYDVFGAWLKLKKLTKT